MSGRTSSTGPGGDPADQALASDAATAGGPAGGPVGQTEVDLIWLEGRIEHWIRFGTPCREVRQDRRRRTFSFAPGSVFALVRWEANAFGTARSELDILLAAAPGAAFTTRPGVRPGAQVLLAVSGWTRVQRALAAIDAVEASGIAPHRAAPDHWGHANNRLLAGQDPRPYARERHRAWLRRRALIS